jgi:hypothetical protein
MMDSQIEDATLHSHLTHHGQITMRTLELQ